MRERKKREGYRGIKGERVAWTTSMFHGALDWISEIRLKGSLSALTACVTHILLHCGRRIFMATL